MTSSDAQKTRSYVVLPADTWRMTPEERSQMFDWIVMYGLDPMDIVEIVLRPLAHQVDFEVLQRDAFNQRIVTKDGIVTDTQTFPMTKHPGVWVRWSRIQ